MGRVLLVLLFLAVSLANAQDKWGWASTAVHASGSAADIWSSVGQGSRGTCESNRLYRGPDCTAQIGRMSAMKFSLAFGTHIGKTWIYRRSSNQQLRERDRKALRVMYWVMCGLDTAFGGIQFGQAASNWRNRK